MADSAERKGARKGKKGAKRAKGPENANAAIVLVDLEDAPQYYSNHLEISHNIHEFEMVFAKIPTKVSPDRQEIIKETGKIELEAMVRIIIPPTLMPDIIRVLTTQQEKYQLVYKELAKNDKGAKNE